MAATKRKWLIWIVSVYVSISISDLIKFFNSKKNRKKERRVFLTVIISWAILIFFSAGSLLILRFNSTIYDVTARVEFIEVKPYKNQDKPDWYLKDIVIYQDGTEQRTHTGTLFLSPESTYSITRLETSHMKIEINHPHGSVSNFLDVDDEYELELKGHITLVANIEKSQSLLLPIEGEIFIGQMIKYGSEFNPILISGEIFIIDKTVLSGDFYSVGPTELKPGDSFKVTGLNTQNSGFIHANDKKGFLVSYRAKGDKAYIFRYKSEPILVNNGVLTKIYNDQTLILIWFLILLGFKATQYILKSIIDPKLK